MTKNDTLKLQIVHDGSCLPICHPEIWDTQNKWNHPMPENRAYLLLERWWQRIQARNVRECDKTLTRSINRERLGITKMQQRGMKLRIEATLVKRDNLFIHTEYERHKNPPNTAAASSYVPPSLQALDHPSHENMVTTIQRCDLLYMEAWSYNHPGLMDFHQRLEHVGGHLDKISPENPE